MAYFRKIKDTWYYTAEVGQPGGKRQKIERAGGRTKRSAQVAYRKAMEAIDKTGKYDSAKITYSDYLAEWMEKYVEVNLSENSILSYKSTIKNHITPALGMMELKNVTPKRLQEFINEKKPKYGKSTLNTFLAVLKKSFSYAVQPCEYLTVSPADHVSIPKYQGSSKKEAYIFKKDELATLFERFRMGHPYHLPMMIAYHTGLRVGECLALQWEDVNLTNNTLSVRYTLIDKDGRPRIAPPKSRYSLRTIPFSQTLHRIFKAQKVCQREQRLKCGIAYKKYNSDDTGLHSGTTPETMGFVCTYDDGAILTSNAMRAFNEYCKTISPNASFHSLRHTHASLLLEHGFDMTYVSKRLGHSKVSITADIYAHVTEGMDSKAISMLEQIL